MKGYLLDTNVVSLLAPSRAPLTGTFEAWIEREDAQGSLFLSVVAVHEIEKGIALLEHRGATARATALRGWLEGLLAGFPDRILPVDTDAAATAGRLEARAAAAGHAPGMADATVAGIAAAHGLVVVTLNTRHFEPFGIPVTSPEAIGGH